MGLNLRAHTEMLHDAENVLLTCAGAGDWPVQGSRQGWHSGSWRGGVFRGDPHQQAEPYHDQGCALRAWGPYLQAHASVMEGTPRRDLHCGQSAADSER